MPRKSSRTSSRRSNSDAATPRSPIPDPLLAAQPNVAAIAVDGQPRAAAIDRTLDPVVDAARAERELRAECGAAAGARTDRKALRAGHAQFNFAAADFQP